MVKFKYPQYLLNRISGLLESEFYQRIHMVKVQKHQHKIWKLSSLTWVRIQSPCARNSTRLRSQPNFLDPQFFWPSISTSSCSLWMLFALTTVPSIYLKKMWQNWGFFDHFLPKIYQVGSNLTLIKATSYTFLTNFLHQHGAKRSQDLPNERIILNDSKLSILWAKNEVILNFNTYLDIFT